MAVNVRKFSVNDELVYLKWDVPFQDEVDCCLSFARGRLSRHL